MCEWSGIFDPQAMKEGKDFTISKPWVGLTDEEIDALPFPTPETERLVAAAYVAGAADEREAMAKDWEARHGYDKHGVAAAIRARGQDPMPLFDDWGKDWKK
jgi:hypothetical protein